MKALALEVGAVIKKTFYEDKLVAIKNGDTTDLVTETDKWVENHIRETLAKFRPNWQ